MNNIQVIYNVFICSRGAGKLKDGKLINKNKMYYL